MAKKIAGPKATSWKRFSEFIRVRDCLETTGVPFAGHCITCAKKFHITFLDAGHAISGRGNAILFHEDSVHAQCRICNQGRHGREKKYKKIMIARYGASEYEAWEALNKTIVKDKDMDFVAIGKEYKRKTDALLAGTYHTYKDMMAGQASW